MKPTFRFYESDRAAIFDYPENKLVLRKGDRFQLLEYHGKPVVVKDGFRYPVNPKLVRELVRRSSILKPSAEYTNEINQFHKLGHTLLKYVDLRARDMSKDVESGFKHDSVYARFFDNAAMYVLRVTHNTISAQVLVEEKQQVKVLELHRAIEKIAQRMTEKFGAKVSPFKQMTAKVANVKMPWGDSFSGIIYSYSAKWSI